MLGVNESFSGAGPYRPALMLGKEHTRSTVGRINIVFAAELSRPGVEKTGKHIAEMRALC
jgi:hypothetical protein